MFGFRAARRLLVLLGVTVLNVAPPGCTDWANFVGGARGGPNGAAAYARTA